jgi:hypothetical protein
MLGVIIFSAVPEWKRGLLFNTERVECFGNFKRVKGGSYGRRRVMTMNGFERWRRDSREEGGRIETKVEEKVKEERETASHNPKSPTTFLHVHGQVCKGHMRRNEW